MVVVVVWEVGVFVAVVVANFVVVDAWGVGVVVRGGGGKYFQNVSIAS